MREIKFRAWHKFLKSWVVSGAISLNGKYLGTDPEEMILMQYTGLKDKNGVEIYEGDILEFNGQPIGGFGETNFKINFGMHYSKIYTVQAMASGFNLPREMCDTVSAKVIGNIYENKDLLK